MKRIGIVGSRPPKEPASRKDILLFEMLLHDVDEYVRLLPKDVIVVSGGADGVDRYATAVARRDGLVVVEHLPDMSEPSPLRYRKRNQRIVDDVEELACFVTPWARGSYMSLRMARAKGIATTVCRREHGSGGAIVTREEARK